MVSVAGALTLADITFESDKTILQTSVDAALLKISSGTKLNYTGTDTAVTLADGTASMTGGEIVGTSEKGTGVSVKGAATFKMSAGSIDKFSFWNKEFWYYDDLRDSGGFFSDRRLYGLDNDLLECSHFWFVLRRRDCQRWKFHHGKRDGFGRFG